MKKYLYLCMGLFAWFQPIYSQNNSSYEDIIKQGEAYFNEAQNNAQILEQLRSAYNGIGIIMQNCPQDMASLIRCAKAVKPMLTFFLDASMYFLANLKERNIELPSDLYQDFRDKNLKVANTVFWVLDMNSKIEFLWDKDFNEEYAYFLRGRAKFFLGMPYLDDMYKAGANGRKFIEIWNH